MRVRNARAVRNTMAALLLLLVLHIMSFHYGRRYWLNLTDSEPMGLYRLEEFDGKLRRGDVIVMAVPSEFRQYVYGRGWLPEGWALFKHVGAVAGDTYCISESTLTINGVTIGPVYETDQEGLPLPRLHGYRQVPAGFFLPVATRIKRSFDGRYMGPVRTSEIRGVARPILTLQ